MRLVLALLLAATVTTAGAGSIGTVSDTKGTACSIERNKNIAVIFPDIKGGKTLNRWLPLVKWFLAIPLMVVGLVYTVIALGMTLIAWIMTWSTGNYPKWAGKFVLSTLRYWNRVNGYAFLLVSDKYPSFAL